MGGWRLKVFRYLVGGGWVLGWRWLGFGLEVVGVWVGGGWGFG